MAGWKIHVTFAVPQQISSLDRGQVSFTWYDGSRKAWITFVLASPPWNSYMIQATRRVALRLVTCHSVIYSTRNIYISSRCLSYLMDLSCSLILVWGIKGCMHEIYEYKVGSIWAFDCDLDGAIYIMIKLGCSFYDRSNYDAPISRRFERLSAHRSMSSGDHRDTDCSWS
jgi:hypothetical protein